MTTIITEIKNYLYGTTVTIKLRYLDLFKGYR